MHRTPLKDTSGLEIMSVGCTGTMSRSATGSARSAARSRRPTSPQFVGAVGMVEEMFTNVEYIREVSVIGSRPVPGSLVLCMAEGLLMQSTMQRTGMAFLEADVKVHKPTTAGDTIHVECEVVEARSTSKPDRGLLRTSNKVLNQRGEVVLTYNPLRMVKTRPAS